MKIVLYLVFLQSFKTNFQQDCSEPLDDHGWSCIDLTQTLDSCFDIQHFAGYDCYGCQCDSTSSSTSSSSSSSSSTTTTRFKEFPQFPQLKELHDLSQINRINETHELDVIPTPPQLQ